MTLSIIGRAMYDIVSLLDSRIALAIDGKKSMTASGILDKRLSSGSIILGWPPAWRADATLLVTLFVPTAKACIGCRWKISPSIHSFFQEEYSARFADKTSD